MRKGHSMKAGVWFSAAALTLMLAGSALALSAGSVLLSDKFSHASKRWQPGKYGFGTVSYKTGKLRFALLPGGYSYDIPKTQWAPVDSMTVSVDARLVSGARHNNMGVICAVDPKNRYQVVVGSNGVYGVSRTQGGKSTVLFKDYN